MAVILDFHESGTFTFAGGLAMLPLIEEDVVKSTNCCPVKIFWNLPPWHRPCRVIAVNCASFVGKKPPGSLVWWLR